MVKMNFTNNQTAFEYVLYMIAASYFDKTVCTSKLTERNMLLQYKEQKLNKQYQMEDFCINFMEDLISKLSQEFFKQNMEVHLIRRATAERTEIVFMNDNSIIAFRAIYAGRKSQIKYKIWMRKPRKNKAA